MINVDILVALKLKLMQTAISAKLKAIIACKISRNLFFCLVILSYNTQYRPTHYNIDYTLRYDYVHFLCLHVILVLRFIRV